MKVRKILREKLRQEWHGPETIESIARRHRLSESTVRKAWADLRRDGRQIYGEFADEGGRRKDS